MSTLAPRLFMSLSLVFVEPGCADHVAVEPADVSASADDVSASTDDANASTDDANASTDDVSASTDDVTTHVDVASWVDAAVDVASRVDAAADVATRVDAAVDVASWVDAAADVATRVDAAVDVVSWVDAAADVAPTLDPRGLLLDEGRTPLPCADPAVVSERAAERAYVVYCTGMAHVWETSDWFRFTDRRHATSFMLAGLSANGQRIGSWWAPAVLYAPGANRYVMWVSVPAPRATEGADGWSARSLAVLFADTPTGPWVYRRTAIEADAGQHFIDPFLFRDHDGGHYVFWKQYGGGAPSRIMGARVDAAWESLVGPRVALLNGYGGPGTWEDNVRENPAVWYDAVARRHHLLFSGGHWRDDSYATGHAVSACGPLCTNASNGWRMAGSGDRGIFQVVRANGVAAFARGGPGGAEFQDANARYILYAANARSRQEGSTRYLMRSRITWRNNAPFVDNNGHHPEGY